MAKYKIIIHCHILSDLQCKFLIVSPSLFLHVSAAGQAWHKKAVNPSPSPPHPHGPNQFVIINFSYSISAFNMFYATHISLLSFRKLNFDA